MMLLNLSHHPSQWIVLANLGIIWLPIDYLIVFLVKFGCRTIFWSPSDHRVYSELFLLILVDPLPINMSIDLPNLCWLVVELHCLSISMQSTTHRCPSVCQSLNFVFPICSFTLKYIQVGFKFCIREHNTLNYQNLRLNIIYSRNNSDC